MKFDEMVKNFVLSEGEFKEPSLRGYIQALEETISKFQGKSLSEVRRIEIAKEQLRGIRRQSRRVEEKLVLAETENRTLQEQLKILEETKKKK